jgi:hypothetical protein
MQPESNSPAAVTAIANFSDVSFNGILDFQIKAMYVRRKPFRPATTLTTAAHIIAEFDDISSAQIALPHCGTSVVSFLPQVLERYGILRQLAWV